MIDRHIEELETAKFALEGRRQEATRLLESLVMASSDDQGEKRYLEDALLEEQTLRCSLLGVDLYCAARPIREPDGAWKYIEFVFVHPHGVDETLEIARFYFEHRYTRLILQAEGTRTVVTTFSDSSGPTQVIRALVARLLQSAVFNPSAPGGGIDTTPMHAGILL
jgi:hypothetical protein